MDERKVLAEDGSVFAAVDVIRSVAPGQPVDVDQVRLSGLSLIWAWRRANVSTSPSLTLRWMGLKAAVLLSAAHGISCRAVLHRCVTASAGCPRADAAKAASGVAWY